MLVSCKVNRMEAEAEYDWAHLNLLKWTMPQLKETTWLISLRTTDQFIHYFRTNEFDRLKLLFHWIGIAGGIGTRRSAIDKFWQVHADQVGERITIHLANGISHEVLGSGELLTAGEE